MQRGGSVYIMTNNIRTTLYIGVTSDLRTRVIQHKEHFFKDSFTDHYNCTICVYYEHFGRIEEAIAREKEIKKWRRDKKDRLISVMNPDWEDLWKDIETW
ncbi:GIY-YIG nuclease family protein [Lacibacter sediminis]|uniref:GIY-YIG nuclease family protein n=1 Tax=Lacibacter sediminis TaxID=2760713 RepID=A0A7G5XHT4_9BACT|nr:GIY-YIG nuclease family protein [Lacibacter sediminis]QNA45037.1 GIY-YIG nuclease family protein [Lacibacter sediminis]